MTHADLETVCGSALFAGLDDVLRDKLLCDAHLQIFESEETVFPQGGSPDALFLLLGGWVKLCRVVPGGTEAVVSVLGIGRSFGELSALHGLPYLTSAETITQSRLLRLDAVPVQALVKTESVLATSMLAAAFVHLQQLVVQIENLTARSGLQRVALFLLARAGDCNGQRTITLPYSKALIAGELGMKPETLSRTFARLRAYGVRIEETEAHIEDCDRLHKMMEEQPGISCWS